MKEYGVTTNARAAQIAATAVEIAVAAPERFSIHGTKVYIPRELIAKLRKQLDEAGIDWRAIQRQARGANNAEG